MYINSHVLAEPKLYQFLCQQLPRLLSDNPPCISHKTIDNRIKELAYSSWHQRHPQHIDQTFEGHWEHLEDRKQQERSLCRALLAQVARYHFDDDPRRIAVRADRFGEWQNWLANQSGLPVIAFQAENMDRLQPTNRGYVGRQRWLRSQVGYRVLAAPYYPLVEDYIRQEGLNESHMHLNGTTLVDSLWHFALCHPNEILNDLEKAYHNNKRVKSLYDDSSVLAHPKDYEYLLRLARRLRQLLLAWVQRTEHHNTCHHRCDICPRPRPCDVCEQKRILRDLLQRPLRSGQYINGYALETQYFGKEESEWHHVKELDLHLSVLRILNPDQTDPRASEFLDKYYLLYLLCMNCFRRILVQRDDQNGFNQFQKFADDGIRERFEKEYTTRFYQLHGPNLNDLSDLRTLEGRFAPKDTAAKNEPILRAILRGFLTYRGHTPLLCNDGNLNKLAKRALESPRPILRLVAHFIKKKWDFKTGEPHFYELRRKLEKQGEALCDLLDEYPELRGIVTGIDAAANELETPPEVFGALYRYCRRRGIHHFTYHVGEDFRYLLSGIRAIYEAAVFLDLRNGDRLGHATAIGIDPTLWREHTSNNVFLRQGEWLENLLFLRQIELESPRLQCSLANIELQIKQVAFSIFRKEVSLDILQVFFRYRHLVPDIVQTTTQCTDHCNRQGEEKCKGKDRCTCPLFVGWQQEEYQLLHEAKVKQPNAIRYLQRRWFDRETIQRYEKKAEYDVDFVSCKDLLRAQQYTQKVLKMRHIVLETLPTSNVRISHYRSIKDHHIFRWMNVKGRKVKGDEQMLVTLGSDDPGIFVTDLRNEFYHVFAVLVNEYGYSEAEALAMMKTLNDNGRIYRFDGSERISAVGLGDANASFEKSCQRCSARCDRCASRRM